MKQNTLTLFFLILALRQVSAQADSSSVYKNLETKKVYDVDLFSQTVDGKETYEVNGKKVSKSTYDKYGSKIDNLQTCCPCILKWYDENDILLMESVSCTDCGVGIYKKFYPNGKVKLSGRFKENPTGNWENIWERKYCNVADGKWTYFNEKGDTLYSEFWENGVFVKQVPEQKTNEIWKVELLLNGTEVDKTSLTPEQVKQLKINLKLKNSAPIDTNFTLKFEVSAVGYKVNKKTFTVDNFHTIDVRQLLSEVEIPPDKKTTFNLLLYNNNKAIASFYLNIQL